MIRFMVVVAALAAVLLVARARADGYTSQAFSADASPAFKGTTSSAHVEFSPGAMVCGEVRFIDGEGNVIAEVDKGSCFSFSHDGASAGQPVVRKPEAVVAICGRTVGSFAEFPDDLTFNVEIAQRPSPVRVCEVILPGHFSASPFCYVGKPGVAFDKSSIDAGRMADGRVLVIISGENLGGDYTVRCVR